MPEQFHLAVNLKQTEDGPAIRLEIGYAWSELSLQQAEWLLSGLAGEYQKALTLSGKAGPPPMPRKNE